MVDRKDSGLLVIVGNDAFAAIRKQAPDSRVADNRRSSIAVDISENFQFLGHSVAQGPSPIDLTFIQHPVERLVSPASTRRCLEEGLYPNPATRHGSRLSFCRCANPHREV